MIRSGVISPEEMSIYPFPDEHNEFYFSFFLFLISFTSKKKIELSRKLPCHIETVYILRWYKENRIRHQILQRRETRALLFNEIESGRAVGKKEKKMYIW